MPEPGEAERSLAEAIQRARGILEALPLTSTESNAATEWARVLSQRAMELWYQEGRRAGLRSTTAAAALATALCLMDGMTRVLDGFIDGSIPPPPPEPPQNPE